MIRMMIQRLFPLALALALVAGCGEGGVEAADKAVEDAKAATQKIVDDVSNLTMGQVREEAGELMAAMGENLSALKETEEVQRMREALEPMIDRLIALKDRLGTEFEESPELQIAMGKVKEQFREGSEMRTALDPFLQKIDALFN